MLQRRRALAQAQAQAGAPEGGAAAQPDPAAQLPPSLTRRYEVFIRPRVKAATLKLRDISADQVGHLVRFKVRWQEGSWSAWMCMLGVCWGAFVCGGGVGGGGHFLTVQSCTCMG